MHSTADIQNALCSEALDAELAGRLSKAHELYRKAIRCNSANPLPYLFLGYSLEKAGLHGNAVQAWSLAADLDGRVVSAWQDPNADSELRQRSARANDAVRTHFTQLHQASVANYQQDHPGARVERIHAAVWCATHNAPFEFRTEHQRPQLFYVPDLAPIAVFDDDLLPWKAALEAAFADIRDEFLSQQNKAAAHEAPYMDASAARLGKAWEPLSGSLNWSSLHLYKDAVANPGLLALFPRTLAAVRQTPTLDTNGSPREVVFSVLKGGQRIPPHFGLANTDATVHLPIVTVPDAGIRVVDTVTQWQEGKVFAFDDAFEHESWNHSTDTRVNLLFGAWHPDLSIDERGAVAASISAREAWNRTRKA